jgi:hypothetical protein
MMRLHLLGWCVLGGVIGCADAQGRLPVAGRVIFKGQPLAQGNVDFLPLDGTGTQSTARISADGRFELPRDRGLSPGRYTVRIYSVIGTEFDKNGFVTSPGKSLVGPEYNDRSTLTVDVTKETAGDLSFDLK